MYVYVFVCIWTYVCRYNLHVCDLVRKSFFHNLLSCCLLVCVPRSLEWQEWENRFPVSASTVGSPCSVACKPAGSLCSATWTGKTNKQTHTYTITKQQTAFIYEIDMVRVFAHGVMGRRNDPSWWTHWAIFHSSQCSTTGMWYVLSCMWDGAYKRTLAANRKE